MVALAPGRRTGGLWNSGFELFYAQSDRSGGRCPPHPLGYFKKEEECAGWNTSSVQLELERILAVLEGAEKIRDVGVIDGLA